MKLAMSGLMAIMVAAAFPAASYAAPRDSGVNYRQHNQQQRVQQGARSGDLTRGETRHLKREQAAIRHADRRFKADGNFTPGERRELQRDQNHASRDIWRERHDGERRFGRDGLGERQAYARDGFGVRQAYGRDGFRERHASGQPVRGWVPGIDRREQREMERIRQGVRSGELTRNEARRLLNEQRMIRQEEREYKSDGVLTRDERKDLLQDLNAANQHIYNETHDAERRFR